MNHYCLCCKHCPDEISLHPENSMRYIGGSCKNDKKWVHIGIYPYRTLEEIVTDKGCNIDECDVDVCPFYEPRPESDLSHCKAVLRMLGVEMGE